MCICERNYDTLNVWLPLIPNAISEVDSVFNSTVLWQIRAVQSILSVQCYSSLLSLLCNAAFPPCNYSIIFSSSCM
jgi:hypothetical protein